MVALGDNRIFLLSALLVGAFAVAARAQPQPWPWLKAPHAGDVLEERFPAPEGFARVPVAPDSFGAFLRRLPLLPAGAPVRAFDGRTLGTPHAAVVDIDIGAADLQQCADSAIRLQAEYLWSRGAQQHIRFHTTSGDLLPFSRYAAGERIRVRGNKVGWRTDSAGKGERDRDTLYRYLDDVFMYAGSISLSKDTVVVEGDIQPGDLLVVGGSPGHVLMVLDVAARDQERRLLIGEGFMPAQSFHVVPSRSGEPWVTPGPDGSVTVPTWPAPFARSAVRRFQGP